MVDAPYQSLYRRYRPQRFGEVRGQDHVTTALRNAVRNDRVGHAYLFSGPRGTGKTSVARILAKALNCTNLQDGEPCGVCESCLSVQAGTSLDVVELDAASNNGVDAMRDLVARAALGSPGRRKVYIVDEVHMLTAAASNALLKTLEEPPAHVVFVLATTDPQKVLQTIRSRTQAFEFHLLGPEVLTSLLADVNDRAGLNLGPDVLERVARRGNGSARDALSALDQAVAAGVAEDEAEVVPAIVDALAARDFAAALVAVAQAVQRGRDPRRVAEEVVEHLRSSFLVTMAPGVSGVPEGGRAALADQATRLGTAALVRAMEVLGDALVDMREALDTRVTLEVALIRLCSAAADTSPEAILQRVEALERALAGGPSGVAPPTVRDAAPPPPPPESGPVMPTGPSPAVPGRDLPSAAPPRPGGPPPRATIGAVRQRGPGRGAGASPRPDASSATATRAVSTSVAPVAIPGLDRDELTRVWGDVIFPGLAPGVRSVFRTGRWLAVEDGTAVFAFEHPQFLERGEDRRPAVEAALAGHFGLPVGVRLVLDPGADAAAARGTARVPPAARAPMEPPPYDGPLPDYAPDDEDISQEEFARLEPAPDAPATAEALLFQAFPGTEEVAR